jgi:hypothetical protein
MNNLLSQALGENCIIKLSPYKVEGAKTNTPLKTNTLYMPPNRQHSITLNRSLWCRSGLIV